ncbi:hypothetical protein E2C00_32255 [Streptomyces sp. WAC05374]|uniref:hypothetical protein n=1 Tax=Streptomyces sp. WAC05374 TaxID=2487420 RepID=UPI000F865277|nr:hypothetical protein [Streptomyces sp. WAC05374]RST10835.1 hypothetical protein EF905_26455 [Streptomyces sp. WAC05374]TDF42930.1 hypothetical protein E2B92_20980 [Streptomyces sp. WAC05374]TDF47772.1 hypothetical protein E2C00_32255 [Streptomyces sp. WAC05374]TDF48956.1 hypothetical protein E2C02_28085 [Streptomyces sp. WAC05374]
MISINTSFVSTTAKMTDRSVVSACSLGLSGSAFPGTGLPGFAAVRPAMLLAALPARERNERPTKALAAGVAAGKAQAYAFAAASADITKQTQQHHTMWAFRGLEPWSDPA